MEIRKLELKDICGYLPFRVKFDGIEKVISLEESKYTAPEYAFLYGFKYDLKPILHPLSDLYKTITHNGKEIVPIVELAKMVFPDFDVNEWFIPERERSVIHKQRRISFWYSKDGMFGSDSDHLVGGYQLFDYLHELKIDYRGLIDAGLAIDVNTLSVNPYK